DIALHPARIELMNLHDLRLDAPMNANLRLPDYGRIRDDDILAPLAAIVVGLDGLAVDVPHEPGFPAALSFVKRDELTAEFGLEYVGQDQYRRLQLDAGEALRWGERGEIGEHLRVVASVEREDREHPQGRVEDDPEAVQRYLLLARPGICRHHPVKSADLS